MLGKYSEREAPLVVVRGFLGWLEGPVFLNWGFNSKGFVVGFLLLKIKEANFKHNKSLLEGIMVSHGV